MNLEYEKKVVKCAILGAMNKIKYLLLWNTPFERSGKMAAAANVGILGKAVAQNIWV